MNSIAEPYTVDDLLAWFRDEGWWVSIGVGDRNGAREYDVILDELSGFYRAVADDKTFPTLLEALEHMVRVVERIDR